MKACLCLLLIAISISRASAESVKPLLERAQVVLSLHEARELFELERKKESAQLPKESPPSPINASIQSVKITAAYSSHWADAEIQVISFHKDWQVIPLLSSSLPLDSFEVQGGTLVAVGQMIGLLTQQAGPVSIKARFGKLPESGKIRFQCAEALASRLEITGVPDGKRLEFAQGIRTFHSKGGAVEFELVEDRPVVPTEWSWASGGVKIVEEAGELVYTLRATLEGEKGNGIQSEWLLPAGADRVEVTGADLDLTKIKLKPGRDKQMSLEWKTSGVLTREIEMVYRIPLNGLETQWLLEIPSLVGGKTPKIPFIVVPEAKVELRNEQDQLLRQSAQLPRWLRSERRYFTGELSAPLAVKIQRLPQLESETTVIRVAEAESRLTVDGALLSTVQIKLEHPAATLWLFSLPPESVLLSCDIQGRPANPLIRESGGLELEIPKSEKNVSEIRLSYTAKQDKLDPLKGRADLLLPVTPLFIYELKWRIRLPKGYSVDGLEGNVSARKSTEVGVLELEKQLVRGETPRAEIFYIQTETVH